MISIEKLDWNLPEIEQEHYIQDLHNITSEDIRMLILPTGKKNCWRNCAKVLCGLSDEILTKFLPEIFEWFKDINWPGTDIIESRIKTLPAEHVNSTFLSLIEYAKLKDDPQWEENLRMAYDDYKTNRTENSR